MANNIKDLKAEAQSTLAVIHSINDDPSLQNNDGIKDTFIKDIPSQKGQFGKKLSDLKGKLKKKKENASNVFDDICKTFEPVLGAAHKHQTSKYKLQTKTRLKQIVEEAVDVTMKAAMQIVTETSQEVLFAGDGICGSETPITQDELTMSPLDFDFLNMLTISVDTVMGKALYENINDIGNQFNRQLYNLFTTPGSGSTVPFNVGTETLFTVYWDDTNQHYAFSGLTGNQSGGTMNHVGNFLKKYFATIHKPTKADVLRMVMILMTMGDGQDTKLFDLSLNDLNRVLQKIFANCGNQNTNGLNQNEPQFNENDEDIEFYFNFDNVEGIDLDDEARRFKKVMKFVDCNNLEVPAHPQHLEDFIYLSDNDPSGTINDILENMAKNAHNDSGSNLTPEDFHLNIMSNYILMMPMAMIATILSPKILLPIILIYKLINGGIDKVKDLMKKLYKLFFKIIRKLYWKFIHEFWIRIKKDLLDFLKITALNILKEKYARYYAIVASLIAILKKVLDKNLDNCQVLYKLVVQTIDTALSAASFSLNIPGFLLSMADFRSGYSSTRAIMNITKMANKKGVNTSPIHGTTNKLNHIFSSMVKGHDEENSKNSKIMSGNKLAIIPIPGLSGPLIIPPGAITTAGVKL